MGSVRAASPHTEAEGLSHPMRKSSPPPPPSPPPPVRSVGGRKAQIKDTEVITAGVEVRVPAVVVMDGGEVSDALIADRAVSGATLVDSQAKETMSASNGNPQT